MLDSFRRPGRSAAPRILVLVGVATVSGCGLTGPAYQDASGDATVVDMTDGLEFVPHSVSINAGETVFWRNRSVIIMHTATAEPEEASDPDNVSVPEGGATFDSGQIPPGEVWRYTFTVPGTYEYVCLPHEEDGMVGSIVVGPAS